jgi:hypothetical protein
MLSISPVLQLPIGFGLGVVSSVFPGLLRPFVMVGIVLLGIQGFLLYQAGGYDALATGLGWVQSLIASAAFGIAGLALGRWSSELMFGRS